jgi:hypothetical protein
MRADSDRCVPGRMPAGGQIQKAWLDLRDVAALTFARRFVPVAAA